MACLILILTWFYLVLFRLVLFCVNRFLGTENEAQMVSIRLTRIAILAGLVDGEP